MGDGTPTEKREFVKILDDVSSISAGGHHSLILKTDGTVWATGQNNYGQLGNGSAE